MSRYRRILNSCLIAGLAAVPPDALAADDGSMDVAPDIGSRRALARAEAASETGRAGAFIQAFNGDEASITRFELENRDPSARSVMLLDARLDGYRKYRRRWGKLDVHAVHALDEHLIAMTARSQKTGDWVSVVLIFDPRPPHKLLISRMDPVVV